MTSLSLDLLNPPQRQAVETTEGRVLVLAGAGSGKTKVLTLRIAYLLEKKNIPPESILGLTFTNKAALEMRSRLAALVGKKQAERVFLSTFHSFAMQVLRKEIYHLGYTRNFSLYDEKDIRRLVLSLIRDEMEHDGEMPSIQETLDALRKKREESFASKNLIRGKNTPSTWHQGLIENLYSSLERALRAYNAVDFDHLLILTLKLFKEVEDVREKYQNRYQYILIDEYQDTNPVQDGLAEILAKRHGNLFVVGDDDQSIYGWRGACIENILQFPSDVTIKLEQNYRSTMPILEGANSVISHNSSRHTKKLWSQKERGELIEVFHAPDENFEAEAVVERLLKKRDKEKRPFSDFAILYRSNILSRPLEIALMRTAYKDHDKEGWRQGIPYQVFGGEEFYERSEIKDIVAYLRMLFNKQDDAACLRIINQPRRKIGEKALDTLSSENRKKGVSLFAILEETNLHKNELVISDQARDGIKKFLHLIEQGKEAFEKKPFSTALREYIENINYKKAIEEEVKSPNMRAFKWQNIEDFISSAKDFDNSDAPFHEKLTEFTSRFSLGEELRFLKAKEKNAVSLMTFHSAKGLEFPVCFLVGLEDHILPHEKSMKETGIEEERRLLYVAMTRAREELVLSMATKRKRMGQEAASTPSRFLFEIPKELLKATLWNMT